MQCHLTINTLYPLGRFRNVRNDCHASACNCLNRVLQCLCFVVLCNLGVILSEARLNDSHENLK